jgi:hypothetical protein
VSKLIVICITAVLIFAGRYWTELAKIELQQDFEVRERLIREYHAQREKPSIEITPPRAPEKL